MNELVNFKNYKDSLNLTYYSFDWDDNILKMPTTIHMEKNVNGKWVSEKVSTSKFSKIRNQNNYRFIKNDPEQAFNEFRDNGNKPFLKDTIKALNSKQYGPSWDDFVECLETASFFSIITARGHEPLTLREGVEYIIDNALSTNSKKKMIHNCTKIAHHLGLTRKSINFKSNAKLSENKLIKNYLNKCMFFGISSKYFAKKFSLESAKNSEKGKKKALEYFIYECNTFAKKINASKVSIGFSDDDIKNIENIHILFKKHSSLDTNFNHDLELNLYDTSNFNSKKKRRRYNETNSGIDRADTGMQSSIVPHLSMNNILIPFESEVGDEETIKKDPYKKRKKSIKKYLKRLSDEIKKEKEGESKNGKKKDNKNKSSK